MTREQLKNKYSRSHYVYLHIDPITRQVVYVGKGMKDRAWQLYNRKPCHKKWALDLKLIGLEPIIKLVHVFKTEEDAYIREKMLISFFRKTGISLFNVYGGGKTVPSGPANVLYGRPKSAMHKLKISIALAGKPRPDNSEPMRIRMKGNTLRKGKKMSELAKSKISNSLLGNQYRSKKILCVNTNKTYSSIKEAWADLKLDERSMFRVLSGEWKHTKGYRFQYV